MKDIRQSNKYAEYLARIGWEVEKVNGEYIYVKKVPVLGSLIKLQRTKNMHLAEIERIANEKRAYQIVVEPITKESAEILKAKDYKLSEKPFLATKSLRLDISKDTETIYKKMKKRARNTIKKTANIKTYDIDKVDQFYDAWEKSLSYKKTIPSLEELQALKYAFKDDAAVLITPNASSGAIFLYANNVGYYWHAFSNEQGRDEKAQYKIVWSGIHWAKQRGAKIFDFEGIYDKRFPIKSWKGFTLFKKSFGGYEIKYPGTFVKKRIPI